MIMTYKRGYTIIEPPIYNLLNWDMDLIVACMEVLRYKIPHEFKKLPTLLEYDLIALRSPHGPLYPVIGIHAPKEADLKRLPDYFELHESIEKWIQKMDLNILKYEANQQKVLTWAELLKQRVYPKR